MRVLIVNTVMLNGGDAAIAEAEIELVKSAFGADTEIVIQDDRPTVTRRHYPDHKIIGSCYWGLIYPDEFPRQGLARWWRLRWFRLGAWFAARKWNRLSRWFLGPAEAKSVEHYLSADLILATGGTYLVEQYDLRPRFFDMDLAIACDRPLLLCPQSIGPFRNRENVRVIRRLCRAASKTIVRDPRSREHLRQLGMSESRIEQQPDVAFALGNRSLIEASRRNDRAPLPCRRVAISVRHWPQFQNVDTATGMRNYRNAVAAVTTHLIRQYGASVTFLSSCQGVDEYKDDSCVALDIYQLLDASIRSHVHVDRGFHQPRALQSELETFDLVIATRMHIGILAVGVGTPVFPIAYEFKTEEVFKALGYPDVTQIESLSEQNLVDSLERFLQWFPARRETVFSLVEQHLRCCHRMIEVMREAVGQVPVVDGDASSGHTRKRRIRSAHDAAPAEKTGEGRRLDSAEEKKIQPMASCRDEEN